MPALRGGESITGQLNQNEHLMVWMRTATTPRFRKLWAIINTDFQVPRRIFERPSARCLASRAPCDWAPFRGAEGGPSDGVYREQVQHVPLQRREVHRPLDVELDGRGERHRSGIARNSAARARGAGRRRDASASSPSAVGIICLVVGCLSVLCSIVFFTLVNVHPRKVGDLAFLSWNQS